MAFGVATISQVQPSGAARVTTSEPTLPAAPGRLSTTTGWPNVSYNAGAISRAMMSLPPPGANGPTHRIGRLGQPWQPG
jgi:hypothetical protein